MKYSLFKCEFPNCDFETNSRTQIHYHHIIPKELNGSDHKSNRIYLCPNCHNRIFVPEAITGIHSISHPNSIVILDRLNSTGGLVLKYLFEDKVHYWCYRENKNL